MSDWKSLIFFFVPDDAVLPLVPGASGFPVLGDVFGAASEQGLGRDFSTVSFDYLVFLDDLLRAYDVGPLTTFQHVTEIEEGRLTHTPAARCAPLRARLEGWQARFLADPGPAADVLRKAEDQLVADWRLRLDAAPQPGGEWLHDKMHESLTQMLAVRAEHPIDGARLLALWHANEGRGYLPDDQPGNAYPAAATALIGDRLSNILTSAFQGFGYIKALQGWCREAEGMGLGMLELEW